MKHSLFILLAISALATLIACKPSVPKEFIQPGDMEDILYDYHVNGVLLWPFGQIKGHLSGG